MLEAVVAPLFACFPAPPTPFRFGNKGGVPHLMLAAANHLIAQSGWAAGRLQPYAGRSAQIVLGANGSGALRFPFLIGADGLLRSDSGSADSDVTLHLPTAAMAAFANGGLSAVMGRIQISGAADLAETLGFVFRHLRWDGEADLARLLGDIPARRLNLLATKAWRWQKDAGRRLLANGMEYLMEERGMVPSPREAQEYGQEVDRLRDDLARLEKRVQRLSELAR